jgi:D-glycerate 3-kinase
MPHDDFKHLHQSGQTTLDTVLVNRLNQAMLAQHLPASFWQSLHQGIIPCAQYLADSHQHSGTHNNAPIVGINGAQGTGKSTLVHFLALILEHKHGLRAATLSIDDFYLSKNARRLLAQKIHPLLATRGVPGTHDVDLGISTLLQLKHAGKNDTVTLPRFDKATDDVLATALWPTVNGPFDIILFEGWCVGTQPQPDLALIPPVNALEDQEDQQGAWRDYVNQQLRIYYPAWFDLLDQMVFLRTPGFEQVHRWRALQEEKLRQSLLAAGTPIPDTLMNTESIARFVAHYQRLTQWNLQTLPNTSNVVLDLQEDHQITRCDISKRRDSHRLEKTARRRCASPS